jgi:hypothetical protein
LVMMDVMIGNILILLSDASKLTKLRG